MLGIIISDLISFNMYGVLTDTASAPVSLYKDWLICYSCNFIYSRSVCDAMSLLRHQDSKYTIWGLIIFL